MSHLGEETIDEARTHLARHGIVDAASWRRWVRKHHPDRNPGIPGFVYAEISGRYDRVFRHPDAPSGAVHDAADGEDADLEGGPLRVSEAGFATLMRTLSKAVAVQLEKLVRRYGPFTRSVIQVGDGTRLLCRASRYLRDVCAAFPDVVAGLTHRTQVSDIDVHSVLHAAALVEAVDDQLVLPFLQYFDYTERLEAAGRLQILATMSPKALWAQHVRRLYLDVANASDAAWDAILHDRTSMRGEWISAVHRAVRVEDALEAERDEVERFQRALRERRRLLLADMYVADF